MSKEECHGSKGIKERLLRFPNAFEMIPPRRRRCTKNVFEAAISVLCAILGLSMLIWPPFKILMTERLKMRPGLPPFDWWKEPPDEVILRAYVFNVTNADEFLRNPKTKLNVVEVGPIVFLEKLIHTDVVFNENSTISYTATRKLIYLPELNDLDLNSTIIVPNWALLGIASFLADQSFYVKFGFNLLVRSQKPEQFVKKTIHEMLWNYTDPILSAGKKLLPRMIPSDNLGILYEIYKDYNDRTTVYYGPKYGDENFFLTDKLNGEKKLPFFPEHCGKVTDASEGVVYPQYITKNYTLRYWRKSFAQVANLYFEKEMVKYALTAYHFQLPNSTFDRRPNDCFSGTPTLPNGLADVSNCHFNFPIASSFPHFLHGDAILKTYVTGLRPNVTKHESFVTLEPTTGLPLEAIARSQGNLVVRELRGFPDLLLRFSNLTIPMFWLEYHQVGIPWYVVGLLYFQVKIVPVVQYILPVMFWMFSIYLIYFLIKEQRNKRLVDNKLLVFNHESLQKL